MLNILKIIFFFNIILMCVNLILFFQNKFNYKFQNIDYPIISFLKVSFKNISDTLNKKFEIKDNISNFRFDKKEQNESRKIICIYFTDFLSFSKYHNLIINNIIKLLNKKFKVKICRNNPDYLFYNVFGCHHTQEQYKKSIKIALFTENQIPDFNIADYSIGDKHIIFLDRTFKFPFFFFFF